MYLEPLMRALSPSNGFNESFFNLIWSPLGILWNNIHFKNKILLYGKAIFVQAVVKKIHIFKSAEKTKQYAYPCILIKTPILSQRLWKIAFIMTILTSNSSSICLMLFQTQIYMNFINTIESIKIRLYQIRKRVRKDSTLRSKRGTSSLSNNTLRVFKPQIIVPYKPAYVDKDNH